MWTYATERRVKGQIYLVQCVLLHTVIVQIKVSKIINFRERWVPWLSKSFIEVCDWVSTSEATENCICWGLLRSKIIYSKWRIKKIYILIMKLLSVTSDSRRFSKKKVKKVSYIIIEINGLEREENSVNGV